MNKEFDINKLEMIIFDGKNLGRNEVEKYNKAYMCWRENWEHAYTMELGNKNFLPSDQFSRQDEVMTIFYDGECAGVTFYNWAKSDDIWLRQDSYFKNWPDEAFNKLCSHGKHVAVASFFTVDFKFRKNYLGISWKDLFIALIINRFILSNADVMSGATRIAKGVEGASYRNGAIPLMKDMPFENEEIRVDYVAWIRKDQSHCIVQGIPEIVSYVFKNNFRPYVNVDVISNKELKNAA